METCRNCNMPQSGWKANGGQGYEKNGERYCCRNCADGASCTCR